MAIVTVDTLSIININTVMRSDVRVEVSSSGFNLTRGIYGQVFISG